MNRSSLEECYKFRKVWKEMNDQRTTFFINASLVIAQDSLQLQLQTH